MTESFANALGHSLFMNIAAPPPAHRDAREPMNIMDSECVCITAAATETASVKRERGKKLSC